MAAGTRDRDGPLYLQIADRLREDIASLGEGARIPSEPQLARDWGVSRFTVAKAVEQLADEGLITRRQGSGTFVAAAPLRRQPGYLLSFTEAVEAAGHKATHQLLEFGEARWQPSLPYPEGAELIRLDRLRLVDGRAVALHRSVISAELAREIGLTREVAASQAFSLYRFFEERGLSVHSATERLVACAAEPEDRKLLNLGGDAVVVAVARHSFAADGTPLDAVNAVYDARRYSYEATLVRQPRNHGPNTENADENHLDGARGHDGPRLGPWNG
ncbi:GntR family transcriptional regulator [Kaistia sp. 32K]|uniref:GntR family transcriptional regulator n=1 Tax=Kaistia sp. 32K TaxID=2795690 RepID=UPI0019168F82|nr:GntR family transcriptional regulator [Kaistia sp. 32K]BCP55518.1 GntR family transcriptional regulator [Kaistia sp. 32K]